ncbi:MAG: hypothetical protein ACRC8L_11930, partial [Plesiomonas shigelloides]
IKCHLVSTTNTRTIKNSRSTDLVRAEMRVLTHCDDMVFVNHVLVKDSFCYISADLSVSANKKGTPQRAFFLFELSSIFPRDFSPRALPSARSSQETFTQENQGKPATSDYSSIQIKLA